MWCARTMFLMYPHHLFEDFFLWPNQADMHLMQASFTIHVCRALGRVCEGQVFFSLRSCVPTSFARVSLLTLCICNPIEGNSYSLPCLPLWPLVTFAIDNFMNLMIEEPPRCVLEEKYLLYFQTKTSP